jgi:hypothetical protein
LVKVGTICGTTRRGASRCSSSATTFRWLRERTWSQFVDNYNEATKENRPDQPLGARERVGEGGHAAGAFDAISMQV